MIYKIKLYEKMAYKDMYCNNDMQKKFFLSINNTNLSETTRYEKPNLTKLSSA